ncbi:VOC family protein [Paraglaciecola sp.]|uniref:VOC family protein n=1 Tax=Paraglaciecola sp. TaxID=1920173 RepID=UPI003EF65BDE
MKGPAQFGVIVYSTDIKGLAEFYVAMFGMSIGREATEFISLSHDGFNLIIHVPPVEIPTNNFNTIKIFLTVDSLEQAKLKVIRLGGDTLEGEWGNPIFKVCNIADPQGNHIQLREFI